MRRIRIQMKYGKYKKSGDNISVINTFCGPSNHVNFQFYCRSTLFGIDPKKPHPIWVWFQVASQRPILAGSDPPTTFGAIELNFCVRYGNRCDLNAIITTRYLIEK